MSNIRVRIAPSPTGFVHVGTLRTVLYNWLFAKHNKGKFVVRIEDTDRTRYVPGALENMLEMMQWAGFDYDEGPYLTADNKVKEKGEFGPYVQSERLETYHQNLEHLIDKGKAYYCFCDKKRLEKLRELQKKDKLPPKYDQLCRKLTKKQAHEKMQAGEKCVARFKMPANRNVVCNDLIRGKIIVNTDNLDDFVLLKTDKFPTYHLANIVDDHLMKITHVLRGDEWIASFPKHILLYEAFNWQPPQFAHLPIIMNKKKQKLSKRHDSVAVHDFVEQGYLKDALLNFIALLGWNSGSEQELYTSNEMVKQFSLDNVHKAPAIFDKDKLDWINGEYIRKLSLDEFAELCAPYLQKARLINKQTPMNVVKKAVALEQPRIKTLTEIADAAKFLFKEPKYKAGILVWKKSDKASAKKILKNLASFLTGLKADDFEQKHLEKQIIQWINENNLSNGEVLWPMRVALSGRENSPNPFEIAEVLGKDGVLARVKTAINTL